MLFQEYEQKTKKIKKEILCIFHSKNSAFGFLHVHNLQNAKNKTEIPHEFLNWPWLLRMDQRAHFSKCSSFNTTRGHCIVPLLLLLFGMVFRILMLGIVNRLADVNKVAFESQLENSNCSHVKLQTSQTEAAPKKGKKHEPHRK